MKISDIAKLAGVSSAAVSRYFNDGYLSEEKREAIRRVVEETGYVPSESAKSLRMQKTNIVGVILPRLDSFAMPALASGILSELEPAGYHLMLVNTQNDPEKELQYIRLCRTRQMSGLILAATVITEEHENLLRKLEIPVVIAGQQMEGVSCVYYNDYRSIYEMTRRFYEHGARNVAYIGVRLDDRAAGENRYRGFCDAAAECGHPEWSRQTAMSGFDIEDGMLSMEELWQTCGHPDGVVCATDKIAAGAITYLRSIGVSIPGQVLISGHGDSDLSRVVTPSLSTIHFPYEESGASAARILIQEMGGEEREIKEIQMGYYLIERESTNRKGGK